MSNVIKFPTEVQGEYHQRKYSAAFKVTDRTVGTCKMCGGQVRRSWVTGILHSKCRSCRYLIMMYGPNIEVSLTKD